MVQKLEMGYCPLSMRLGAGQALARAGERHGMGARQGERAHGRGRQRCGGSTGARGRSRQGRAGRPAGWPVRVWCVQLGQVWCFGAPDSVFGLV